MAYGRKSKRRGSFRVPAGYKLVKAKAKRGGARKRASSGGRARKASSRSVRPQKVTLEIIQRPHEYNPLEGLLASTKKEVKPKRARL